MVNVKNMFWFLFEKFLKIGILIDSWYFILRLLSGLLLVCLVRFFKLLNGCLFGLDIYESGKM